MSQLLFQVIMELEEKCLSVDYTVSYKEPEFANGAYTVTLDGKKYVGSVCYWPESVFEFQFHSRASGNIVVLETIECQTSDSLVRYLNELIINQLG